MEYATDFLDHFEWKQSDRENPSGVIALEGSNPSHDTNFMEIKT